MLYNPIRTATQFRMLFDECNRRNQFSWEALDALFNYYDEFDENMEADVIAICCDWTEYESADEAVEEYSNCCTSLEDLQDRTTAIELENGHILVEDF